MDAVSKLALDRLRQGHATRADEIATKVNPPSTTAQRLGAPFNPGDRVFDTGGGFSGTVEASPTPAPGGSALVYFRTDTGQLFATTPDKLIPRPTPPAGRP